MYHVLLSSLFSYSEAYTWLRLHGFKFESVPCLMENGHYLIEFIFDCDMEATTFKLFFG